MSFPQLYGYDGLSNEEVYNRKWDCYRKCQDFQQKMSKYSNCSNVIACYKPKMPPGCEAPYPPMPPCAANNTAIPRPVGPGPVVPDPGVPEPPAPPTNPTNIPGYQGDDEGDDLFPNEDDFSEDGTFATCPGEENEIVFEPDNSTDEEGLFDRPFMNQPDGNPFPDGCASDEPVEGCPRPEPPCQGAPRPPCQGPPTAGNPCQVPQRPRPCQGPPTVYEFPWDIPLNEMPPGRCKFECEKYKAHMERTQPYCKNIIQCRSKRARDPCRPRPPKRCSHTGAGVNCLPSNFNYTCAG